MLAGLLGGNLLVLVDQHAAHERIRLEQLIIGKDLLRPRKDWRLPSGINVPERICLTVTMVKKMNCTFKTNEKKNYKKMKVKPVGVTFTIKRIYIFLVVHLVVHFTNSNMWILLTWSKAYLPYTYHQP